MAKQFITEAARMQKLAGIINETEENTIDEGFKDWLIGLGLTAATIAGGAKVYQMDKAQEKDRNARIAYYNKNLSPVFNNMGDDQKSTLGSAINDIKKELAIAPTSTITPEEFSKVLSNYAETYIKNHPNEFSIGEDSLIYWNKIKENPYK